MKISYDKKVDAINVSLKRGSVKRTVEVSPEIILDLDKKGNPLNIEILGASEKVGVGGLDKVVLGKKAVSLR